MEQSDILRNLRIEQLTPMQEAAQDAYQSDKDLVLLSPTGSGKTLAFLLPLVQSLKAEIQGVQAVVLAPSRELALQIETVFKSMSTPFKAMSCYGGRPAMEEHRTMRGVNPAVIIGTPGRMNDHLRKRNFDTRFVTALVIDEFDKCLEFGFHDEMAEVIGQLPALKKRVLLSATDAEEIPQFAGVGGEASGNAASSSRVIKLNFLPEEAVSERLNLQKVISPEKDKLETLYRLLCTLGDHSTLVFVNYRESVERVVSYLKSKKFPCDAFHGGMTGNGRFTSSVTAVAPFWYLPTLPHADWTFRVSTMSCTTTYPSTKKPLRIVTDVRHVGKRAARLSFFSMRKNAFPIISRKISPYSGCRSRRRNRPNPAGLPYI